MDQELKQKWVAALRSGEFKQAYGDLKRDGGYCCLGVLCVVAGIDFVKNPHEYAYDNSKIPQDIIDMLWKANDSRKHDFNFIANMIEANL